MSCFLLEAPPGLEPGVRDLQSRALPLGYGAKTSLAPDGSAAPLQVAASTSGTRSLTKSNPLRWALIWGTGIGEARRTGMRGNWELGYGKLLTFVLRLSRGPNKIRDFVRIRKKLPE